jgi:hypothetical protein
MSEGDRMVAAAMAKLLSEIPKTAAINFGAAILRLGREWLWSSTRRLGLVHSANGDSS